MYLYDEGTVIGLLYGYDTTDLQPFYYQRNIFGDVIAIRDTVGTKVVEYAYDAWGNSTVVSYSNADTILSATEAIILTERQASTISMRDTITPSGVDLSLTMTRLTLTRGTSAV